MHPPIRPPQMEYHKSNISSKANQVLDFLWQNLRCCPTISCKESHLTLVCLLVEFGATIWNLYSFGVWGDSKRLPHHCLLLLRELSCMSIVCPSDLSLQSASTSLSVVLCFSSSEVSTACKAVLGKDLESKQQTCSSHCQRHAWIVFSIVLLVSQVFIGTLSDLTNRSWGKASRTWARQTSGWLCWSRCWFPYYRCHLLPSYCPGKQTPSHPPFASHWLWLDCWRRHSCAELVSSCHWAWVLWFWQFAEFLCLLLLCFDVFIVTVVLSHLHSPSHLRLRSASTVSPLVFHWWDIE